MESAKSTSRVARPSPSVMSEGCQSSVSGKLLRTRSSLPGSELALAARDPQLLTQFLRRAIMRVVFNEQALIARLRRRNQELQSTLDTLRATAHRLNQTEALTRTDELTGLANRRGFGTHIEQRRRNSTLAGLSLILIDCDRFKHVNDTHGHLAGDRVLQSVANLLRAVAGPEDIACRLGGLKREYIERLLPWEGGGSAASLSRRPPGVPHANDVHSLLLRQVPTA